MARLKDDGYSAFKEIRRDDFVNLIGAIERDEVDVVIVRDVDRLTRNLANPDAAPRQRVILRLDIDEAEAAALRDAAERVLHGA